MDDEFKEWIKGAAERNLPEMKKSHVFASILTDDCLKDPMVALQLGLVILLDKPIVIITDKKTKLPANLVKIAKLIERIDITNPDDLKRASRSVGEYAKTLV